MEASIFYGFSASARLAFCAVIVDNMFQFRARSCSGSELEVKMAETKFEFKIIREIAVLSTNKRGWNRELNVVSWNNGKPKWEIRDWAPDHERAGKGIGLSPEEVSVLREVLEDMDPYSIEE